ncbi:MAG: TonB-dependent receptor plug domain-containing protein, partial [Saprospiraceae bacterium]|nr:TonB-dependent receptor plug domain-containing protein [Saprospiraceae bacterium]
MKKSKFICSFVWLLAQYFGIAQQDSTLQLAPVEVTASSLRNDQTGSLTETWQTSDLTTLPAQSAADFLRSNAGIYLKTYGAGSLATTSIRGASAGQTAVVWNGFQIQSPMLGLLDWSLLPTAFTDEISLQYGGNGAIWGSGALGGTLLLNNNADFSKKKALQFAASHGSFGQWNGQTVAKFSNQYWASSTRIFRQQSENDFTYSTAPGHPNKRQTNAAMHQEGIMQEVYWRPNGRHQLGLNTWLQSAYREIPPTTVQARSLANQHDRAIRTALHWRYAMDKQVLQLRSAGFKESIHYRDELQGTDAPSHFWTSITEADLQRQFSSKIQVQITGNQTFTKAFIKNYPAPGKRTQSAIFASMHYGNGPWSAQLDARQAWANGKIIPFTPSFGLERKMGNLLKIGARLGRNYRLPSLNDLYWAPGGNTNLKAESGWAEELNARFELKKANTTLGFTSAVFNRNIKNWIQWLPTEGQPYWSASNIKAVRSRGMEHRLHLAWTVMQWQFGFEGGYDFVRSTNQEAITLPKIDEGQQWFYVPEHQGFVNGSIHFKGLRAWFRQQFTGSVITEFGQLGGYKIASTGLDYLGQIRGNSARFFLQIDNLWNANYRVIERRPMP